MPRMYSVSYTHLDVYKRQAPEKPDCCLYHHRGFASLTGGLQAADQAQNAETSATTVSYTHLDVYKRQLEN